MLLKSLRRRGRINPRSSTLVRRPDKNRQLKLLESLRYVSFRSDSRDLSFVLFEHRRQSSRVCGSETNHISLSLSV